MGQPLSHLGDALSLSGVLRTTPWWSSVIQLALVTRLPLTPRGEDQGVCRLRSDSLALVFLPSSAAHRGRPGAVS